MLSRPLVSFTRRVLPFPFFCVYSQEAAYSLRLSRRFPGRLTKCTDWLPAIAAALGV